MNLEWNEQFKKAWRLMEEGRGSVFVTGRAGTGKSTLLNYFRDHTRKTIVVLAPTGVAAVTVRGQTIHSFFGFKPDITPHKVKTLRYSPKRVKLCQKLEAIVIDEISMTRADLLDSVDQFLRLHGPRKKLPFGGIQMILIGDLYQLAPVVSGAERELFRFGYYQSPYFFAAKVFENLEMQFVELEKIYRQKDEDFINLLNTIRNNTAATDELEMLNRRHLPDFVPKAEEFYISLTTTNALAEEINSQELERLPGKESRFTGQISGRFDLKDLPTAEDLRLRAGAQVMLLNNDPRGRWVNGTIGKVKKLERDEVKVTLPDGRTFSIGPYRWEMFEFYIDPKNGRINSDVIGSFTQIPLRLAWAVTIHKSQGKTFEKVILDIGRGTFAHGQLYVALSRCTSLEGMILKKPIAKKHILMDWRVVKFMTDFQYELSEKALSLEKKVEILKAAIKTHKKLRIIYLKSSDEKSNRVIEPLNVGEMEYEGKPFLGVAAYCHRRQDERVFRVDRILEIRKA